MTTSATAAHAPGPPDPAVRPDATEPRADETAEPARDARTTPAHAQDAGERRVSADDVAPARERADRNADARLVAAALADARSGRAVEPDSPAGPARQRWRGAARRVPGAAAGEVDLGAVLALSLAARPVRGTSGAADGGARGGRAGARPRGAASAGGRHPVRAHLLVGPGCPIPPGRYAYDPLTHRVHRRGPAPDDAAPGVVAVLTVAPQRTVSHYGHRAWPLLLLDTGHAAAALALAAMGSGHAVRVSLDADGARLAAAAGLPAPGSWRDRWPGTSPEHPLAAVHVHPGTATGPAGVPSAAGKAEAAATDAAVASARAAAVRGGDACPLAAWATVPPGAGPAADGAGAVAADRAGAAADGAGAAADGPGATADGPVARRTAAVLAALTRAPDSGARPTWWRARPPRPARAPAARAALLAAVRRRRSAPPPLTGEPDRAALATVLRAAASACPSGPAWCAAVGGEEPGLLTPAHDAVPREGSPEADHRDRTVQDPDRIQASPGTGGDTAPGVRTPEADHQNRTVQKPDDRTPPDPGTDDQHAPGHGSRRTDSHPADSRRTGSRPDVPDEPGHRAVRDEPRPRGADAPTPPQAPPLRLLARGEARPTLAAWAAGQGWLADAGAVLLAHGAPTDAPPARVRGEHLAAGYAVACAEVTATALGLRTRPVGSWQRADLGAALGGATGERWVVHGLALAALADAGPAVPEAPAPTAPEPTHPAPAAPAHAAAGPPPPGAPTRRTAPRPRVAEPNSAGNERR